MNHLFELDFSRWDMQMLYIFPAFLNFGLFVYTLIFLPQNRTNISFAIFVLVVGLWQASEGLMRLSFNPETADAWYALMGVLAVFVTPLGVNFTLNYYQIRSKMANVFLIFVQFTPAFAFAFLMSVGLDAYTIVQSEKWYWVFNPIPSPITNMIYMYVALNGILMLLILIYHFVKAPKESIKRKQSLLLASGLLIPLVGGIICEVWFPYFLNMDVAPVTTPLFTFFSIASLLAIIRFDMFDYSPKHHWEEIVETIDEGILILNSDQQIMYTNDALSRVLGYSNEVLYGTHEKSLYLDTQEYENLKAENKFDPNESFQSEFLIKAACGRNHWMIVSRSPYKDLKNKVIGVICIFTNIDRRKRAEIALKEDKERLRLAIDSGRMMTIDVNYLEDQVLFSENVENILGLKATTFNIHHSIENLIHPDDKLKVMQAIQNTPENVVMSLLQYRLIRPDNGEIVWLERRGERLTDGNGNMIGFKGILMDITANKEAELNLQNLLDVTKDQNERLQNFTYIVSHNIRSHSANISGIVSLMKDEHQGEEFTMLERSSNMLSETIENLNEIITFQRDAGSNLHAIKFKKEVDNTMQAISSLIRSTDFEIEYNLPENLEVVAVPSYLESILLNLFTNAIKYRHSDRKPKLCLSFSEDKNYSVVSFSDNGLGIDLQKYGKDLFGMYKTFHNNKDSKGLGLFITRNQIEAMNGKIEVESEPGIGTKFTVYFPKESKLVNREKAVVS